MHSYTHASSSSAPLPPRRTPNKPNWTITNEEVEQGCILWLGTIEETIASQARRGVPQQPVRNVKNGQPANMGMFEHPILAISRPASDPSKLFFLPMTSLGGKSLQQRYVGRKSSYHQATFVPVTPAIEHPHHIAGDTRYRTLMLENGESLERSTFVNIRELYMMDWEDAQLYWGSNPNLRKPWKLDAASIRSVIRLAGMHAGFKATQQFRPGQQTPSPPRRVTTPIRSLLPTGAGLGIEIPSSPSDSPMEGFKSSSAPPYSTDLAASPTSPSPSPINRSCVSDSGVRLPPLPALVPFSEAEPSFPVPVAVSPVTQETQSFMVLPLPQTQTVDQRTPLLLNIPPSPASSNGDSSVTCFCYRGPRMDFLPNDFLSNICGLFTIRNQQPEPRDGSERRLSE